MTDITTYHLRAESGEALWQMLSAASAGKTRAYAFETEGQKFFDEARVRRPYAEMAPGAPMEETNPETGEVTAWTPLAPTGFWLCEVILVGEEDSDLAAIAANQD